MTYPVGCEAEDAEAGEKSHAPPARLPMPNARPPDRFVHDPGADGEAGHERHQKKSDVLVENAFPGLVGEDKDRLKDDAEESRHGHQQGAAPGGTQSADQKQERHSKADQPPEIPRTSASSPNPGRSVSASFGKNRASQIMTAEG